MGVLSFKVCFLFFISQMHEIFFINALVCGKEIQFSVAYVVASLL
jgi:hypothetical protein